ncbi:MAG TPA: lyase family protein [Streptosporangiaceae bacterium]|nr:lyase family protein [Streptosporangiaceae bacterium]
MNDHSQSGLFGSLFARGAASTSDEAWLQAMLDTEAALARAAERAGLAPPGSGAAVTSVASSRYFSNADLSGAAAATGNPVPALVKTLTGLLPAEPAGVAGAVHLGATSQDIIDTAAMLIARQSLDTILADLASAAGSCAALAREHAATVMAGRTLLQQAVPVTFGLVAAGWLTAIDEARLRLHEVRASRLAIQYGGAAGTLASLGESGPRVAELLADELGLSNPVLPWHTSRLRVIELAAALAGACAAMGKLARDVTLLAQTEVGEVAEDTAGGTKGGSSAMPHKQNPVASVVVLGNAKAAPHLLASLASAAEQEHQRAAGAWHSEWLPFTGLLTHTISAAAWTVDLLAGLRIDPARMRANLGASHGLPMAEHVTTLLAPVLGRLEAHALVAAASAAAARQGLDLSEALLANEEAAAKLAAAGVSNIDLKAALAPGNYLGATSVFIEKALEAHAAWA